MPENLTTLYNVVTTTFLVIILTLACTPKVEGPTYLTVKGESQNLGRTLIHEHVLVDFIGADSTGYHRWNKDDVISRVLPYLEELKEAGAETLLDCTPAYLGRDPILLKRLSDLSGLNILTNTGFYGAANDKYIPSFAYDVSADSLASIWTHEFQNGIEDTGIRPGFIKIAVDPDSTLSAIDEKLVMAAIRTHLQTGLTIVSHTGPDRAALAQMKIIEASGIDPSAWVWTHAQAGTSETHQLLASKGAWISIDNVNEQNIDETISKITSLKKAGFLHKTLISHDAGWFTPGEPNGGEFRGYNDIFDYLIPQLLEAGFTDADIDQLLVENPEEAYRIRIRRQ